MSNEYVTTVEALVDKYECAMTITMEVSDDGIKFYDGFDGEELNPRGLHIRRGYLDWVDAEDFIAVFNSIPRFSEV